MEAIMPVIFVGVLAASILLYVLLDGFDLGVGILYLFEHDRADRDTMMLSIAPIWDGNETWLVAGAVLLLAGFPAAYAAVMPAFYLPLMLMLLALIFRGVAFEFRFKARRSRFVWDMAFAGGSVVAAFCQGLVLGGYIGGTADGDVTFRWLSPFAIFCGAAVVAGYTLHGACWLIMKAEGELEARMRALAPKLLVVALAALGAVSLWTPLHSTRIAERWFAWPNIALLAPVPIATALCALWLWRTARTGTYAPFLAVSAIFALGMLGLGVSLWPYVVPFRVTIWDSAAPMPSLWFSLIGVILFLPAVLAYTAWSYWVFRGKVRMDAGAYH